MWKIKNESWQSKNFFKWSNDFFCTSSFLPRGVQPVALRPRAAQDGCECNQNKVVHLLKISWGFSVITCLNIFNVWPRDAKRLDTLTGQYTPHDLVTIFYLVSELHSWKIGPQSWITVPAALIWLRCWINACTNPPADLALGKKINHPILSHKFFVSFVPCNQKHS